MTDHHQARLRDDMLSKASSDAARVIDLQLRVAQQVLTVESMCELKILIAGALVSGLVANVARYRSQKIDIERFVDDALAAITEPAREVLIDLITTEEKVRTAEKAEASA